MVGRGVKRDPKRYSAPGSEIHSAATPSRSGRMNSEPTEQTGPENAEKGQNSFLPPLRNVVPAETILEDQAGQKTVVAFKRDEHIAVIQLSDGFRIAIERGLEFNAVWSAQRD